LLLLLAATALAATPESDRLRTFFAFEREAWLETPGAKLALAPPRRHPSNPVIPRGAGTAPDSHRVCNTTVIPEGVRLRAWYGSMQTGTKFTEHTVSYAESTDGIRWTKPNLDLRPGTNVVLEGASALVVQQDPAGGYRAAAHFWRPDVGQPGAEPGATFEMVTSRDGLRWDYRRRPSIDIRHFEIFGMFHRDGRWWVLGQGVSPYFRLPDGTAHRRVMYGFHSEDGSKFDLYPRPLFRYPANPYFPDSTLQNHVGAAIWDRGRVLLGFVGQLWPSGFSVTVRATVGLIYSHDGIRWSEPFPQTPILLPGAEGSWDGGMLFQVQRPVSRDGDTYLYYSGGDSGNVWQTREALGLALLRRDGFAALEPVGDTATAITALLEAGRGETTVYTNARGPVTLQILDRYLRPVSAEVSVPEGVRVPVLELAKAQAPARFRLAFKLGRGAELYTFSLGPAPSRLRPLEAWE
jgi:hypothetical protein